MALVVGCGSSDNAGPADTQTSTAAAPTRSEQTTSTPQTDDSAVGFLDAKAATAALAEAVDAAGTDQVAALTIRPTRFIANFYTGPESSLRVELNDSGIQVVESGSEPHVPIAAADLNLSEIIETYAPITLSTCGEWLRQIAFDANIYGVSRIWVDDCTVAGDRRLFFLSDGQEMTTRDLKSAAGLRAEFERILANAPEQLYTVQIATGLPGSLWVFDDPERGMIQLSADNDLVLWGEAHTDLTGTFPAASLDPNKISACASQILPAGAEHWTPAVTAEQPGTVVYHYHFDDDGRTKINADADCNLVG